MKLFGFLERFKKKPELPKDPLPEEVNQKLGDLHQNMVGLSDMARMFVMEFTTTKYPLKWHDQQLILDLHAIYFQNGVFIPYQRGLM